MWGVDDGDEQQDGGEQEEKICVSVQDDEVDDGLEWSCSRGSPLYECQEDENKEDENEVEGAQKAGKMGG